MLRVSYSNPVGYVDVTQVNKATGERFRYRLDCCFCNTDLFAEIEHTGTEHILHLFFANNEHLRNILKDDLGRGFLQGRHYHFNSFYGMPNKTTCRLLNQLGAKVSFFYKDPNKKNKKGAKK